MLNRLVAHIFIAFIFGYLYLNCGTGANTVLANYVYLYGSMLLIVYTGQMSVTLACKYQSNNLRIFFKYQPCNLIFINIMTHFISSYCRTFIM